MGVLRFLRILQSQVYHPGCELNHDGSARRPLNSSNSRLSPLTRPRLLTLRLREGDRSADFQTRPRQVDNGIDPPWQSTSSARVAREGRFGASFYTRQSVGSSDELSSCAIQRGACAVFAASQGWIVENPRFDDVGFSGATVDRPALRRLLSLLRDNSTDHILNTPARSSFPARRRLRQIVRRVPQARGGFRHRNGTRIGERGPGPLPVEHHGVVRRV
jgi:hypothetical protein